MIPETCDLGDFCSDLTKKDLLTYKPTHQLREGFQKKLEITVRLTYLHLQPAASLSASNFCCAGGRILPLHSGNVIHQKLARSAREVLTDYAIGTKSAQPGLMGGGGGRIRLTPMQSQSEIHNFRLWLSISYSLVGGTERQF